MLNIKGKFNLLLLFLLGTAWGNWWITEILSCPEWWFIGEVTLLTGCGICIGRKAKEDWQRFFAAIFMLPVVMMPAGNLQSAILPLFFGIWYGSNDTFASQWKLSRVFCGGLLLGSLLAGVAVPIPLTTPVIAIITLLIAGLNISAALFFEMILLSAMIIYLIFPAKKQSYKVEKLDPGTVLCALSLVPERKYPPVISFIGGEEKELINHARELFAISNIFFLPDLPGTLPRKSDLIVIRKLPETGDSGTAAIVRSLRDNGVILLPVKDCALFRDLSWHILPGSEEKYAAASPGRILNTDPELMDESLIRHFRKIPEQSPPAGLLSGMLIDFKSEKVFLPAPVKKDFFRHIFIIAAAAIYLTATSFCRKNGAKVEKIRIFINSAGYTMMAAVTIPVIFAGLPTITSLRALITAIAIMWLFRRPYPRNKNFIWFAGLLALVSLAATFSGNWIFAAAALVFGGYTFAVLDEELCKNNDSCAVTLRFLAAAAGAFAVYWMQKQNLPPYIIFTTAAVMRTWSWLRN